MEIKIVFFPNLPRNYRWPRTEECPISLHSKEDIVDICHLLGQLTERKLALDDSRIRRIQKTSEWLVGRDQEDKERNRNGRIVASAMLIPVEGTLERFGFVESVVVDKPCRRQGVASLLMQRLIEHAFELKLSRIESAADPERTEANSFLSSLGFAKTETNCYRRLLEKGSM